ncbi:MAG: phosphoenolpyruvate carboxykinase (GTP), partial [Candidatus Aureabacteria bacterium]|nr:phosphoenolpyruvate carboxykinase (GTP) [Candidatus Auribacterota bacterium]
DKEGRFCNAVEDKRIWLKWMRLRADKEVKALLAPTGLIPKYEDLRDLFKEVLSKAYSKEDYLMQFTIRIPENLAKIERINNIYSKQKNIPPVLFTELNAQEKRLKEFQEKHGNYIFPEVLQEA